MQVEPYDENNGDGSGTIDDEVKTKGNSNVEQIQLLKDEIVDTELNGSGEGEEMVRQMINCSCSFWYFSYSHSMEKQYHIIFRKLRVETSKARQRLEARIQS